MMRLESLGVVVAALVLWSVSAGAQPEQAFFYSGGERIYGSLASDWIAVRVKPGTHANNLAPSAGGVSVELSEVPEELRVFEEQGIGFIKVEDGKSAQATGGLLARLREDRNVEVIGQPFYLPGAVVPFILTNEFVVRFKTDASLGEIQELNSANSIQVVEQSPFVENEMVLRPRSGSGRNTMDAANRYYESGLTAFAHPNFIVHKELRFVPNDPLYPHQWHLNNTGQWDGTIGADIDAEKAWDISRGSPGVIIAVIDNGVEIQHEDLQANAFVNPGELPGDANADGAPGVAGIDDDGDGLVDEDSKGFEPGDPGYTNDLVNDDDENGFPDDLRGWNFIDQNGDTNRGDAGAHGTLVTGLAAARGDNETGVSGTCPQCAILPIVFGDTFNGDAQAFRYAEAMGADIITNSWGYSIGTPLTDVVVAAIQDVAANGRDGLGCVITFGMSNIDRDDCAPPNPDISSLESVIAISKATNQDTRGGGGRGDCMDLLAPTRGETVGLVTTDQMGKSGWNKTAYGHYYNGFGGTSGATPQVAGAAGLILSVDPDLRRDRVQELLEQTADKIDASSANYDATTGFSYTHGHGRVNARGAVLAAMIEKALRWLRDRQDLAGSWRSWGQESVGVTSMAAASLLGSGIPESDPDVQEAIDWILSNQRPDGSITAHRSRGRGSFGRVGARAGESASFWKLRDSRANIRRRHVYDTSLAMLALLATGNWDYFDEIEDAAAYLMESQNDEDRGFRPSQRHYGGWPGRSHRADVWSSGMVLLALHHAEQVDPNDALVSSTVWEKAATFFQRSQNREASNPRWSFFDDGGFIFAPGSRRWADGRSYASATTAGLFGAFAMGEEWDDPLVQDAMDWLSTNYFVGQNYPIGEMLLYQYLYGLSTALALWDIDRIAGHIWYDEMVAELASRQDPDGHWPGAGPRTEPDVLATCWAILALLEATKGTAFGPAGLEGMWR